MARRAGSAQAGDGPAVCARWPRVRRQWEQEVGTHPCGPDSQERTAREEGSAGSAGTGFGTALARGSTRAWGQNALPPVTRDPRWEGAAAPRHDLTVWLVDPASSAHAQLKPELPLGRAVPPFLPSALLTGPLARRLPGTNTCPSIPDTLPPGTLGGLGSPRAWPIWDQRQEGALGLEARDHLPPNQGPGEGAPRRPRASPVESGLCPSPLHSLWEGLTRRPGSCKCAAHLPQEGPGPGPRGPQQRGLPHREVGDRALTCERVPGTRVPGLARLPSRVQGSRPALLTGKGRLSPKA